MFLLIPDCVTYLPDHVVLVLLVISAVVEISNTRKDSVFGRTKRRFIICGERKKPDEIDGRVF